MSAPPPTKDLEGGVKGPVSCFCRAGGIYSHFALKRVERMSGREPTFLLAPVGVHLIPALAGESSRESGKNPRSRRAGGALGGAGNRRCGMESREAEVS